MKYSKTKWNKCSHDKTKQHMNTNEVTKKINKKLIITYIDEDNRQNKRAIFF